MRKRVVGSDEPVLELPVVSLSSEQRPSSEKRPVTVFSTRLLECIWDIQQGWLGYPGSCVDGVIPKAPVFHRKQALTFMESGGFQF